MHTQETNESSVLFGQISQEKIIDKITDKKTRNKMFRLLFINIILFFFVCLAFANFKKVNTEKMLDAKINLIKQVDYTTELKHIPATNLMGESSDSLDNQLDIVNGVTVNTKQLFNINSIGQKKKRIATIKIKNVYQVNSDNP